MASQVCSTCGRPASERIGAYEEGGQQLATPPCSDQCHDLADKAWSLVDPIKGLAAQVEGY
jgi:hypothetical protein